MLLRLSVLFLLMFAVALPNISPAYAAAATATDTCAPEVKQAQEERSVAMTKASNEVYKKGVQGIAPTAGLTCMDKIMGDWSRIGSIFSDTGNLEKKLFDHAKAFAIPFLANYLAGQFDIGGFTFSFDFTSVLSGALNSVGNSLGLGGLGGLAGGAFGPAFTGCNDANDMLKGVVEKGMQDPHVKGLINTFNPAQKTGGVAPVPMN